MQHPIEPFVVSGEGILTPPDRTRWVTRKMFLSHGGRPVYSSLEVSHVIFGRGTDWLRERIVKYERKGTWSPPRTEAGHRRFGLHDVEDLAHLLLDDKSISAVQFAMVVRIVKSLAVLNLYEIGDTGFLVGHWNDADPVRKELITEVMDQMEHREAGLEWPDHGPNVLAATKALVREETLRKDRK